LHSSKIASVQVLGETMCKVVGNGPCKKPIVHSYHYSMHMRPAAYLKHAAEWLTSNCSPVLIR